MIAVFIFAGWLAVAQDTRVIAGSLSAVTLNKSIGG